MSYLTSSTGIECVLDQVKFSTVWESKPMNTNFISALVGNLNLREDENDAVATKMYQSPVKSCSGMGNLNDSAFESSTPNKCGPMARQVEKLAFDDILCRNCSPIKSPEESLENMESVSNSSTSAQQGSVLERNEIFEDHANFKVSPISPEVDNNIGSVNGSKSQATKYCKRSLEF